MAAMKDTAYWGIFAEVWGLFKESLPPQNTGSYWDGLVERCGQIMDKYRETPEGELAKAPALAVPDEIERLGRVERGEST